MSAVVTALPFATRSFSGGAGGTGPPTDIMSERAMEARCVCRGSGGEAWGMRRGGKRGSVRERRGARAGKMGLRPGDRKSVV